MLALSFAVQRKSFLLRVAALALPVVFLLALLVPTVFAQTTYVITDGDQVKVYTTYSSDPADVLGRKSHSVGGSASWRFLCQRFLPGVPAAVQPGGVRQSRSWTELLLGDALPKGFPHHPGKPVG